jgi:hypothetical protein
MSGQDARTDHKLTMKLTRRAFIPTLCPLMLALALQTIQHTANAATAEQDSALVQQLAAAQYLGVRDPKKQDSAVEVWAYLSLRMPGQAQAALQKAGNRMAPGMEFAFYSEVSNMQSSQAASMVQSINACAKAASKHNLSSNLLSELKQRCDGRLWTNANEGMLSVYLTNLLPMCEVRIPQSSVQAARSGDDWEEKAQILHFVTELSKLRLVLPVVNLTDSTISAQVEVRCLGGQREADGSTIMRSAPANIFTPTPSNSAHSNTGAQAALEQSILALCLQAAKFAFPTESPLHK